MELNLIIKLEQELNHSKKSLRTAVMHHHPLEGCVFTSSMQYMSSSYPLQYVISYL